jgi:hypothetical protein
MPGLGPRVGGAHVDVNLKFDDKSVGQVGKAIHRQLSNLNKSLVQIGERNRSIYQSIGKDAVVAWRSLLGTIVAGAPLMGSAISGVAGAATLLAGALYSTVQASYGFAPLLAAIGVAAGTAFLGLKSFFKALKDGDLSGLTPSAKAAAKAVQGLGDAWGKVRDTVQENMFKGLADDIAKLGTTLLPVLQRGLGKMGTALNGLAQDMLDYVNSAAGMKTIEKFLNNSADIFDRFAGSIVPFLDGFLRLMNALAPAGKRLADRITDVAERFQSWTQAEGFGKRIDDMMKRAEKTAGLLFKVLGNLGGAIANIFNAANPATNQFLQMLVDVTARFKEWTSSTEGQNSIATWAAQAVDVMRQFGETAEAAFKVIAELADPRVIISFLKTLEGAFEILGKLPLDKIVSGFATIAETLQPVSSLFLAIVIGGAALNIMFGALIGQVGGLFSVFAKLIKFKILINVLKGMGGGAGSAGAAAAGAAGKTGLLARAWGFLLKIIQKVKGAFSGVVGFFSKTSAATGQTASKASKLAGAFKPVLSILGRFAKFAGPVGIAVWIGSIIAKSDKLKAKFGDIWDAMKKVGSALSGAFKEIGEALSPLAPAAKAVGKALGPVFGFLDKLMGLAIGVVLDAIVYAFESLANVIKGAGKIIAGFINVLIGLFTLDFGKVWDGLKQMASGIVPLLKGVFGLFISFFAPARLAKLGLGAIKGLGGGIAKAMPGILSTVGRFLGSVLKFFATLPIRLLGLGARAIAWLGRAFISGAGKVLSAAGRLVTGVIGWIARLPVRLFSLGVRALSRLGKSVVQGTPKVLSAAGRIVMGVIKWIARLPGRLFSLGMQTVSRLAGAVTTGIGRLRSIAGRIFTAVVSFIARLPGRLLSLGQQAVSRLAGAVSAGVGRLRSIAGNIVSTVTGVLSGLPGKLLSIGKNIIGSLISGIASGIGKLAGTVGKVAGTIGKFLPGSPVKEGPLTAWNHGSGATGGGRNVIDAITGGLRNTDPIKKAMQGIASAVSTSLTPTVGAGALAGGVGGSVTNTRSLSVVIQNPAQEPASDSLTRTTRNLAYLGLT